MEPSSRRFSLIRRRAADCSSRAHQRRSMTCAIAFDVRASSARRLSEKSRRVHRVLSSSSSVGRVPRRDRSLDADPATTPRYDRRWRVIRAWWSSRSSKSSPRHSVPGGGFDSHPLRQSSLKRSLRSLEGLVARISISPLDALLDQPVAIAVSDVNPGSRVRVRLRAHSLNAESTAEFVANDRGVVDVAAHPAIAGDYEGIEPAGLFWSARFDAGSDVATMIATLSRLQPLAYTATVSVDGRDAVSADFTRRLLAANVVRTPVRAGRMRGALFAPAGTTNAPGVVVLGGSDGGNLYEFVAALLAAHGIAALALAYFAHDDLPKDLIE